MGRMGYLVFESDMDLDLCGDVNYQINEILGIKPPEELPDDYNPLDVSATREQLDDGLYDQLFDHFRSREDQFMGQYTVVILGAQMMRTGAKISNDNWQHLRELIGAVPSHNGYVLPIFDLGFTEPGKAQYLAAMNNYQEGTPRSFEHDSCFNCGKTHVDTGKKLLECSRCHMANYCDKTCQKANWRMHKEICRPIGSSMFLNV